jgi:hypothetical protein
MDPGWWDRPEGDDLDVGSAIGTGAGGGCEGENNALEMQNWEKSIEWLERVRFENGEARALHIPFFPHRLQM